MESIPSNPLILVIWAVVYVAVALIKRKGSPEAPPRVGVTTTAILMALVWSGALLLPSFVVVWIAPQSQSKIGNMVLGFMLSGFMLGMMSGLVLSAVVNVRWLQTIALGGIWAIGYAFIGLFAYLVYPNSTTSMALTVTSKNIYAFIFLIIGAGIGSLGTGFVARELAQPGSFVMALQIRQSITLAVLWLVGWGGGFIVGSILGALVDVVDKDAGTLFAVIAYGTITGLWGGVWLAQTMFF